MLYILTLIIAILLILSQSTLAIRLAFVGDQGIGTHPRAVLGLIRDFQPDGVVLLGDFDYKDNPRAFMAMLTETLGPTLPLFPVIGNHDVDAWSLPEDGYADLLKQRHEQSGLGEFCEGELGVNMACVWNNTLFILSGIGTLGSDHLNYTSTLLTRHASIPWKFCAFHKNSQSYQTGDKESEVPIEMYDLCRSHGAIITTAHDHAYERTHLMSSFTNHSVAKQGYHKIHVKRGESFAVVSGLGGDSIRSWYKDLHWAKWWASTAALDNGVNYGALLCTLQEPSLFEGNCEFRDIDGNVWDRFRVSVEEPRKKVGKTVPIQSDTSAQNTRLRVQFTTGPNENSTPLTVLIPVNCPPSRILTIQNQKTRRCAHHKEFQISHSSLTGSLEWTSPEIPRISLVTDQDEQVTVTFKTDSGDWSVESLEWV